MDVVLIKIAWLFMLLLVITTFAQQQEEQQQQQQNGLSKETSSTSSSSSSPFTEPLSNVPDPASKSGLQGEFQKAKLGLDAFQVGKQQADRIKDKIPKVGYSRNNNNNNK